MRIFLGIVVALVVVLGGLYVAGAAQPNLPVAGAAAQALQQMTGVASAEGEGDGEESPGLLARLTGAVSSSAEGEDGGDSGGSGKRTYYQYVDDQGKVHFVQNVSQIPARWRDKAGKIEMKQPVPTARSASTGAGGNAPARSGKRPFAYTPDPTVAVYTAPWCGWCRKTLAWLDSEGVRYTNKDIEANPALRDELIKLTGRSSIPVVQIDGELVRGFDPDRMTELLSRS